MSKQGKALNRGYTYTLYCIHTGDWILNTLAVPFPKTSQQVQQQGMGDDLSGIELESPHKSIAVAQEFPVNIEGIGDLRTLWIGQQGIKDIQQKKLHEETHTVIQAKATDLRALAVECLRPFTDGGLEHSDLPQVQKAINMCLQFASHTEVLIISRKSTNAISALWKKEKPSTSLGEEVNAVAPQDRAATVLGEKLVTTMMQSANH